ncbi:hypothetical protein M0R45_018847 [Rubus argutus]|uniref:Uncharacterized protein n=1 Tax=Rubus argutus TaxID=59490 RepID=A0AAW1X7H4_RUBAR
MLVEMSGQMGLPPTTTTNQLSRAGSGIMAGIAGAGQSGLTDEVPSCSTSPSTNNCSTVIQPLMNNRANRNTLIGEDMAQSAIMVISSSASETMPSNGNLVKGFQHKSEVKPSVNIARNHSQGMLTPQTYLNGAAAQTDYLDTSSSQRQLASLRMMSIYSTIIPVDFQSTVNVIQRSQSRSGNSVGSEKQCSIWF